MIAYSGYGTRETTLHEQGVLTKIAEKLRKHFILYSGNCSGADRSFIEGSNGNCVLFLPWASYDSDKYDFSKALDVFDVGKTPEGQEAIKKYHPNPNMKYSHRLLIGRNWHIIMGYGKYPPASFGVLCADPDGDNNVCGGSGQGYRIGVANGIPQINIRCKGWEKALSEVCKKAKEKHNE